MLTVQESAASLERFYAKLHTIPIILTNHTHYTYFQYTVQESAASLERFYAKLRQLSQARREW